MNATGAGDDGVQFAQKLLELLDQGSVSTSYKYALLLAMLAMLDCCVEYAGADGLAPPSLTTRQLAEAVLELYWPHAAPFEGVVLRQSNTGQAEVVTLVRRYREGRRLDPFAPLARCRNDDPAGIAGLTDDVEWKFAEMPLPRLQRFGGRSDPFVYVIGWDESVRRSELRDTAAFDNSIRFVGGAAEHLLRFAPLLRPLIQRKWAAQVARLNSDVVVDAGLEAFLFGASRVPLDAVRGPLRESQDDRCFYCDEHLGGRADVDHFLPWARHPDNGLANLVVAHPRCNNSKRDFLAAAPHVARWAPRLQERTRQAGDLARIAAETGWELRPELTLSTARAFYMRLSADAKLWVAAGTFADADLPALRAALAG